LFLSQTLMVVCTVDDNAFERSQYTTFTPKQ